MDANVTILTESTFQTTIGSGVTLVDFWAPWCGPCRAQLPILEAVASKAPAGATVAKLNVDEAQNVAGTYGVMSIPTIIVFKDGAELKRFVGVQQEQVLLEALNG